MISYSAERCDVMNKPTKKQLIYFFIMLTLSNGIGFLLSLSYDEIYWLSAFLLLILTTGILNLNTILSLKQNRKLIYAAISLVVPLIYFTLFYSLFSSILFSAIILLLSLKKQFLHFDLFHLYRLIESFIFLVVLNSFSFYAQTFFFSSSITIYLLAIYLMYTALSYLFSHLKKSDVVD